MTPHLCPPWCVNPVPHDDEGDGYFHDGEPVSVDVILTANSAEVVHVRAAQFVEQNNRAWSPRVIVQDNTGDLVVLTPASAREAAQALVAAADELDGSHGR